MTIKARNRVNLGFCIFYTVFLFLYISHFAYQVINGTFSLPEVFFSKTPGSNFVFSYNSTFVLAALFFMIILVTSLSFIILRAFSKTQSLIINFFLIFLFACFCDTARFFIIFNKSTGSYSQLLFILGNCCLFARILAPLALLMTVFTTYDEQVQNLNRNFIILLLSSLFMTFSIPLNTTKILPNFCIAYGFPRTILIISILLGIAEIVALVIYNIKNHYSQKTAIGFGLTSFGYLMLFNCTTLFMLILGIVSLTIGTYLYIYHLHANFLWR